MSAKGQFHPWVSTRPSPRPALPTTLRAARPKFRIHARMDEKPALPAGDAELVRRIRAGDERALEAVFKAHYAGMASFVQRFVRSHDLAEELVQDVFLKLWSKREQLAEIETFRTYLFRAARNTALNYLRRAKLERRWREEQGTDDDPPPTFAADEGTAEQEVAVAVQEAINRLPPRCREIFLLSRDGGLTYAEIARSLEISVKTVETQMGRALKSLRSSLQHFRE